MTTKEQYIFWLVTGVVSILCFLVYNHRSEILKFLRFLKLKIFPINFVVTLAIEHNSNLNSGIYFSEIKKILLKELELFGLREIVTVTDFSDIYIFPSQSDAEKFRNRKDINLIVWGNFTNDGLKSNGESISILAPNFTYGYGHNETNQKDVKKFIDERINKIAQVKKHWAIHENNSLTDVSLLGKNLSILVTFIVGLTLGTKGKIDLTTTIFEKLYKALQLRNDDTADYLNPDLMQCYKVMINNLNLKSGNQEEIKTMAQKILSMDDNDFAGLVFLAFSQYKTSQVDDCKKTIKRLLTTYPKSDLARIDAAFIDILDGKYGNALKKYKKIFNDKKNDFHPQDVTVFLYNEYQNNKEPALMFACGVINYHLIGNMNVAKEDLELFLKKGSLKKHGVMYSEAVSLMEKIISSHS